jgi:hypothetical protein
MNQLDWNQASADAFVCVLMTGRPVAMANHLRGF